MGSIALWNEMLESFLDDLSKSFPEEKAIKDYKKSIPVLVVAQPRYILDIFVREVTPFSDKIALKDDTMFTDCPITLLKDINMGGLWGKASDHSKEAIWSYLNTLLVLAKTLSVLPPEAMNMIEKMAMEMQDKMPAGGLDLDPAMLSNMLTGLSNQPPK